MKGPLGVVSAFFLLPVWPLPVAASGLQDYTNPHFVTEHRGKLVFAHDGGVAVLDPSPETLSAAGLTVPNTQADSAPGSSSLSVADTLRRKTQTWLLEIQARARPVAAPVNTAPKVAPVLSPVEEPKKPKTAYEAVDLVREYDPGLHLGNTFQVAGTITKITEVKGSGFHLLLDDKVLVSYQGTAKVKARDTGGSPRDIGAYKIGDRASFLLSCSGVDSSGKILMGF